MVVTKAMTEKERELFSIFKSAAEAEHNAQAMYQKAIDLCEEPQLKAVLTGFRNDEARHEKEVLARYRQFKKDFPTEAQ